MKNYYKIRCKIWLKGWIKNIEKKFGKIQGKVYPIGPLDLKGKRRRIKKSSFTFFWGGKKIQVEKN